MQTTHRFELLVYSCRGVQVDGVHYQMRVNATVPVDTHDSNNDVRAQLRDIGIGDTTEQAKFTVERAESVRGEQQHVRCLCDVQQIVDSSSLRRLHPHLLPTAAPLRIGWPGAAQLRHGSLVRIGCGTYVFAVVD